ncbi:hypothetical protein PybrP1_006699 [[Pythium] brassicae (nom. inval.)]|nr:hypothetical protein PybrP1_006699 [[Pythium] brassicae (nom. inval.)]
MSETHPFECDVQLVFPAPLDAQYALETLQVDGEIQPDKIHRTLAVDGAALTAHFEATEIRLLRAAVASFYDMALLVARTLLEFKE